MKVKLYYYFRRNDPTEEPIGYVKANSHTQALNYASKLKNLSILKFDKIYDIKEK
jgi:hypothetical protein|tara:strand:+ start:870 stop:1034 length:165 start_codon:yes stop_codon:yes gene_type:complete